MTTTKHRISLFLLKQTLLGQTKVREARVATLVNQNVLWFYVPVNDTVPMDLFYR